MKLPILHSCDREMFICKYAKGQRVLHVGCADMPWTEHRIRQRKLLHQRLALVADDLTGVDISEAGIRYMQAAGIPNLYMMNAESRMFDLLRRQYDVIIAGEILEHVLNAGIFIESLKSVLHPQSILIITTPNFAPVKRLYRLLYQHETVAPEHVCYYSYATLSALFGQCGLHPIEWGVYWLDVGKISQFVNKILRKCPFFVQYYADGFCVACTIEEF